MKSKSFAPLLDPAEFDIPPISNDPEYSRALAEINSALEHLKEIDRRREIAVAIASGNTVPGRNVMQRARDLMAGATIPATDPARTIAACDEEARIIQAGIREMRAGIAEIVAEHTLAMASRFRKEVAAAYRAEVEAMRALLDAHEVVVTLMTRLKAAGYGPIETYLPSFAPWPVIQQLGTDQNGGWFWRTRKFIEENGL